eukprot:gene18539-24259_t
MLIDENIDINVKCHGISPIHLLISLANLPDGYDFSYRCLQYIFDNINKDFIDIDAKDDQGSTFFHLACELSDTSILTLVLNNSKESLLHLQIKDRIGYLPIHRAVQRNLLSVSEYLLSNYPSLSQTKTSQGDNLLHLAASNCSIDLWNYLTHSYKDVSLKLLKETNIFHYTPVDIALNNELSINKNNKIIHSSNSKKNNTAVITDHVCLEHHTCHPSDLQSPSAPPENVHRLKVLIDPNDGILYSNDIASYLKHITSAKPATITDILRVHEWTYVRKIQSICLSLDKDVNASSGLGSLDGDTTISYKSFQAASVAAGCVCSAVDMIINGEVKNAFCPIRPPGHHAGPRGVVKSQPEGSDSHGFCLLNNISIGAAYAMNIHRNVIKKVAIVDFDVHHGNGTEETVRWLQPNVETNDVTTPNYFGSIYTPTYKPWYDIDDARNVFFVSVHGYGPRQMGYEHLMPQAAFYPGSGRTTIPTVSLDGDRNDMVVDIENENDKHINTDNDKLEQTIDDLKKLYDHSLKVPSPLILDVGVSLPGLSEEEVTSHDAIFISAGFDAHKKDTINAGYISLVEEDFEWITTQLVKIANTCCDGRVISALEGGYQLGGEFSSAFAKSVKAHVNALAVGSQSKSSYKTAEADIEKNYERNILDEIQRKKLEKLETVKVTDKVNDSTVDVVVEDPPVSKRRRSQVDYIALDTELNRKKNHET